MFKLLFYSLKQALAKGLKPGTEELLRASFVWFSAQRVYSLSQDTGRRGSCCWTDKEGYHSTNFQRFSCDSSFRPSQQHLQTGHKAASLLGCLALLPPAPLPCNFVGRRVVLPASGNHLLFQCLAKGFLWKLWSSPLSGSLRKGVLNVSLEN